MLLVEDNRVNQEVARRLLSTLGVETVVVENGHEAVQTLQADTFDIVLMDCQMPVMDGYEATRVVRHWESSRGQHVPIIAMTANALPGDREKCLSAGMDAYITKPIKRDALAAELSRWLQQATVTDSLVLEEEKPVQKVVDPAVLDEEAFTQMADLMGDAMGDLIDTYLADTPAQIATMTDAILERNFVVLGRAAHSLKSSSAALGVSGVSALARDLEAHARAEGSFEQAQPFVESLRQAFELARPRLMAARPAEAAEASRRGRGA